MAKLQIEENDARLPQMESLKNDAGPPAHESLLNLKVSSNQAAKLELYKQNPAKKGSIGNRYAQQSQSRAVYTAMNDARHAKTAENQNRNRLKTR